MITCDQCHQVLLPSIQRCDACTKQAQLAALRQRLGDCAVGLRCSDNATPEAFAVAINRLFDVKPDKPYPNPMSDLILTPLAAWLWERGIRA